MNTNAGPVIVVVWSWFGMDRGSGNKETWHKNHNRGKGPGGTFDGTEANTTATFVEIDDAGIGLVSYFAFSVTATPVHG